MRATTRAMPAAAIMLGSLTFAGCGGAPVPAVSTPAASDAPSSPAPTPDASPSAAPAPDVDPTCETIIPADTVEDFEEIGWSAQREPFRLGDTVLAEGLQCTWGDYSVASDRVQIFGWAPVSPSEADAAQNELVAAGWRREESPEGVYVTESADTAIEADADGYGITYFFGPGWVKLADTKQGLLLVEWPPV